MINVSMLFLLSLWLGFNDIFADFELLSGKDELV